MNTTTDFWASIEAKRKSWQPPQPAHNTFKTEAPNTIVRGLSLRQLELPVRDFILTGLDRADSKKLGVSCRATLLNNVKDETRHDTALTNCYNALERKYSMPQVELEASNIVAAWQEDDNHPITKAAVLENGVFFVLLPLFNLFGYQPLRETSQWISGDEILHVQSHRKAAQLIGAKPTASINKLRRDTVDWLVTHLEDEVQGQTKDKWLSSSDSLMTRGISQFLETQFTSQPAFFEISNANMSKYN